MPIKLVTPEQAKAALKLDTLARKSSEQIDILCGIASTESGMRSLCAHSLMTAAYLNYFEDGEVKDILKAAVLNLKYEPKVKSPPSVITARCY